MSSIKLKHSGGNSVSLNPPTSAPTSTEVAFKLPNEDGSANQVLKTDGSGNLGFVAQSVAGITMADQWRRTQNCSISNGSNYLTTDWERVNSAGQGTLPVSTDTDNLMSQSGGIFTFPSTGIYKVEWQCYFEDTGSAGACAADIYITTDNNTYTHRASSLTSVFRHIYI